MFLNPIYPRQTYSDAKKSYHENFWRATSVSYLQQPKTRDTLFHR